MVDEDVIHRVANLAGLQYSRLKARRKNWKPTFRVVLRGASAVKWMLALRPLMGARRQAQIDTAIAAYNPNPGHPCNRRYAWPTNGKLLEMRRTMSWRQIAKQIGCTHTSAKRRILSITNT